MIFWQVGGERVPVEGEEVKDGVERVQDEGSETKAKG